ANLKSRTLSLQPAESFQLHTQIVAQVMELILTVADSSGLSLDAYKDTYYMQLIVTVTGPDRVENLAVLRGQGAGIAARKSITPIERAKLSVISGRIQAGVASIRRSLGVVFREDPGAEKVIKRLLAEVAPSTAVFLKMV